jgi:hypothetical protein
MDADYAKCLKLLRRRNEKRFAWLRYLVGLASGALAVLVSLGDHQVNGHNAGMCLRLAWIALGCGILLGASAIYAEVASADAILKAMVRKGKLRESGVEPDESPYVVFAGASEVYRYFERACYVCLCAAVGCLVGFALLL